LPNSRFVFSADDFPAMIRLPLSSTICQNEQPGTNVTRRRR
jgi:hypothetical protein